jgi:hypothetical protein
MDKSKTLREVKSFGSGQSHDALDASAADEHSISAKGLNYREVAITQIEEAG